MRIGAACEDEVKKRGGNALPKQRGGENFDAWDLFLVFRVLCLEGKRLTVAKKKRGKMHCQNREEGRKERKGFDELHRLSLFPRYSLKENSGNPNRIAKTKMVF